MASRGLGKQLLAARCREVHGDGETGGGFGGRLVVVLLVGFGDEEEGPTASRKQEAGSCGRGNRYCARLALLSARQ